MVCLLCCSIVCSMFHVPSKQALFFRQGVLYVDVGLSSFATFNFYNNKKAFTRSGLGWELKRSLACVCATAT